MSGTAEYTEKNESPYDKEMEAMEDYGEINAESFDSKPEEKLLGSEDAPPVYAVAPTQDLEAASPSPCARPRISLWKRMFMAVFFVMNIQLWSFIGGARMGTKIALLEKNKPCHKSAEGLHMVGDHHGAKVRPGVYYVGPHREAHQEGGHKGLFKGPHHRKLEN